MKRRGTWSTDAQKNSENQTGESWSTTHNGSLQIHTGERLVIHLSTLAARTRESWNQRSMRNRKFLH